MSWRVVYIEESDHLSLYLDNIKIRHKDNDITIPLSDIHTIIVDNYKTVLTVNLINKCMEYNINLLLCGIDHMPVLIVQPIKGNNQSAKMLFTQINWNENIKKNLHMKIIKGKILNQRQVLEKYNKSQEVIKKLNQYISEVEPGDVTNREGLASKIYFRELFGKDFIRFEDDVINAGLNYGYTIIRIQIAKVLLSRGLNPALGIFHRGPENTFNLADDIIEVFRPIVDSYVYKNLIGCEALTREHRVNLIKLTTKKMFYNNEHQTFFNVLNLYVNNILDILNNGVNTLIIPEYKNYDI